MRNVFIEIQYDIDWRLAELRSIERILQNLNEGQQKIILKNTVPMIYAHWEGFVVGSMKKVFEHLNGLGLNNEHYCCTYLTLAYEKDLKSLDDSSGFDKRKKYLEKLYIEFNKNITLPKKIDTNSNLNFKTLKNICQKTNLKITNFNEYSKDLGALINIRNSIAHGENAHSFDDFKEIEKYVNLLESLMSIFQNEIQDLLQNEKYKEEIA